MNPEQLKDIIVAATTNPWAKMMAFIPNLLGMVIILLIGYIISRGLQKLATLILRRVGFDRLSSRVG